MLEAFGLSDPGCVRQNNEDFYLIYPGVYIVADGMGGAQAGEHASKLAVETVASFLHNSPAADAETLFQAFREANQRVMKEASSHPELEGMGTTLVVALEDGPELLIASVGDSRVNASPSNTILATRASAGSGAGVACAGAVIRRRRTSASRGMRRS